MGIPASLFSLPAIQAGNFSILSVCISDKTSGLEEPLLSEKIIRHFGRWKQTNKPQLHQLLILYCVATIATLEGKMEFTLNS